jgi:hypothetical protein
MSLGCLSKSRFLKRKRENERETEKQRDRETERQRDRETERQRDRETERQSNIETQRQRERETERQKERERERDTASERQRQTEKDRQKERKTCQYYLWLRTLQNVEDFFPVLLRIYFFRNILPKFRNRERSSPEAEPPIRDLAKDEVRLG